MDIFSMFEKLRQESKRQSQGPKINSMFVGLDDGEVQTGPQGDREMTQEQEDDFLEKIESGSAAMVTHDGKMQSSTPLHFVAMSGYPNLIRRLLEKDKNLDLNAYDAMGNTPLHAAILGRQPRALKALIDVGANVDAPNLDTLASTPLHAAVLAHNLECINYLLEAGADYNLPDSQRMGAIHLASLIGDIEMLECFLKHGANINAGEQSGAVFIPTGPGTFSVGRPGLLIPGGTEEEDEAIKDKVRNAPRVTPLHTACTAQRTDMATFLLEKGADIEAIADDQVTPLHCSAQLGSLPMVKLLVEHGANLSAKTAYGSPPLFEAASGGHLECVRYLVEAGADINQRGDSLDRLVLHEAATSGDLPTMKFCFEQGCREVNDKDALQNTPLHLAAKSGSLPIVDFLVQNGAIVDAKNHKNKTPKDIARRAKHTAVVRYLNKQIHR